MKKFRNVCLALTMALTSLPLLAQDFERCHTMQHLDWKTQRNPAYADQIARAEAKAAQWLREHPDQVGRQVLDIPVVVHVVYTSPAENIPDAQVMSQMDVLNADFRRLNADTMLTRPEFDSLASDFEINFCLANIDPNGNPTTGITRTSSSGGSFFGFFGPTDDVKSSNSGGVDPWPTDQYLNIWVCPLLPIIAGYAQFPGEDPTTDGVVVGWQFFGTQGDLAATYNKGRTTTHEVGHWLGLRHIWGDGDCTMDDFVDDTPKASANNSGNCFNVVNSCVDSLYDYNDMVENYMDYSNDSCMNMFTEGQKARAWSFLNTDRTALFTSAGCSGVASGLRDGLSSDLFHLYPTPASGSVWIEGRTADLNPALVEVVDIRGQVVLRETMELAQDRQSLDLSDIKGGVYFVRLISGERQQVRKLVVR